MSKAIGEKFSGIELSFFLNVKARKAQTMERIHANDTDDACHDRAESLPDPANVVALLERDRSARRLAKASACVEDVAPVFKSNADQVAELEIEAYRLLKAEREAYASGDYDRMMHHRHSALAVNRKILALTSRFRPSDDDGVWFDLTHENRLALRKRRIVDEYRRMHAAR